ncbi:serine hydrolase [Fodinibius sp. SL11]|uniref:serine hydrolase n=1 Tax=Fodinibius sp. SL11 TaxID=3425690 RepID=UPI003F883765
MSIAIVSLCMVACTSPPETIDQLENKIRKQLASVDGEFAIGFKMIDRDRELYINEREMFHAASTMKTPVMIELFKQANAGNFSLDDSIQVKNEFRSIVDSSRYQMDIDEDSEGELYDLVGQQRPIRELINDMITKSSNLATNILIEKVGAGNVTKTMRNYGADSIKVLRGVEDIKAYERGISNRTTAFDEVMIYEKLARGEVVNKEASETMIAILKEQKFNEMIPAQLPNDVEVAHKTGWITGVNHDVGFVELPNRQRYVLVLLSKEAEDREQVLNTLADISRTIYDFVQNQ